MSDSCATCGVSKCTKACGDCKTAMYCDIECQAIDWEIGDHAEFCGRNLQGKIHKVMHEFGKGRLRDSHGRVVTDKKQALAIAYSEYRRHKQ